MNSKTDEEARALIETMASNEYQIHNDRGSGSKRGIIELDTQNAMLVQNKLITRQLQALQFDSIQVPNQQVQQAQDLNCDFCGGDQDNGNCEAPIEPQEQANYMWNLNR